MKCQLRVLFWFASALLILSAPAWAAVGSFTNGDFETGDFTGWTLAGGANGGIGSLGAPSLADTGRIAITSAGFDPIVTAGGGTLSQVYGGAHSARVEDSGSGARYSQISQTVTNWTENSVFFAWAAVLQEPGHAHTDEPFFNVVLRDLTTATDLYNVLYAADTIPGGILHVLSNGWKYTDWQVVNLDTTAVIGHDLRLTLIGADCALGAHAGYAYLDGIGNVDPGVPEPAALVVWSLLAGLGIGVAYWRRRK